VNFDKEPARTADETMGVNRPLGALLFDNEDHLDVIDGLRAIAIIPVVAFHVGVPLFSGGFVGVDVFFVISGFLITRLLFRELSQTGRIDVLNFYARRVRRLLPALGVVLVITLVVGLVYLTPAGEQQELSSSTLAAAGFASNFYFWRTQTGYFAGPSDQLPLLHMWTLAVEEQFYIVWPITMIVVALLARRLSYQKAIVVTLFVGSLASFVGCWIITASRPTAAFYLTPFRAWEFGVGGLLVFLPGWLRYSRLLRVCSFAGAAAIATSVLLYNAHTEFPGAAAVLPVFGAAAIILGSLSHTLVSRLLATQPMITVGKWSYSWYLWHWPLLAIGRSVALGEHDLLRDIVLAGVALMLSAATFRWVEEPIRRGRPWPFKLRGTTVATGAMILVSISVMAVSSRLVADANARSNLLVAAALAAQSDTVTLPVECAHFKLPFAGLAPIERCTMGNSEGPLVVLWGDSHAHHFIPGLVDVVNRERLRLLPRVMGACPPVTLTEGDISDTLEGSSCISFNRAVIESLPRLKVAGATVVILAARWFVSEFWAPSEAAAYRALAETVESLQKAGLQVVLFADVPGYSYSVPQCIVRKGPQGCRRPRPEVNNERASAMRVLAHITTAFPGVKLWDPIDEMCDEMHCMTVRQNHVLYRDSHHITASAARSMSDSMYKVLQ
jgi:peptidoglycan/LPS O-acetylase OafA/YrhL